VLAGQEGPDWGWAGLRAQTCACPGATALAHSRPPAPASVGERRRAAPPWRTRRARCGQREVGRGGTTMHAPPEGPVHASGKPAEQADHAAALTTPRPCSSPHPTSQPLTSATCADPWPRPTAAHTPPAAQQSRAAYGAWGRHMRGTADARLAGDQPGSKCSQQVFPPTALQPGSMRSRPQHCSRFLPLPLPLLSTQQPARQAAPTHLHQRVCQAHEGGEDGGGAGGIGQRRRVGRQQHRQRTAHAVALSGWQMGGRYVKQRSHSAPPLARCATCPPLPPNTAHHQR
jgi:hypothetical protein